MSIDGSGIVIVGAGLAGAEAAFSLRDKGETRAITLIGQEPCLPYDRPPLSKAYLKGELHREHLWLRPQQQYAEERIDVRLGLGATAIDRDRRILLLDSGESLGYEQLILATGGEAKGLAVEGTGLEGVQTLKSLQDADTLMIRLGQSPTVVVIGGGYVGMEFAATARLRGCDVTLIEGQSRVLSRSLSPVISSYLQAEYERRGVKIITGAGVAQIDGGPQVRSVLLSDGRRLSADLVLLSVGNQANDSLALEAGLAVSEQGGVLVDQDGRTSDPQVFAIGDCASRLYGGFSLPQRLESVQGAVWQAKCVAAAITQQGPIKDETPWFWSDQFDIKLQMAGLPQPGDCEIVRGDPSSGRFSVIFQNEKALTAVQCVNCTADFIAAKKIIPQQRCFATELLRDLSMPMRDIARANQTVVS